jgi:hypothetical protein
MNCRNFITLLGGVAAIPNPNVRITINGGCLCMASLGL